MLISYFNIILILILIRKLKFSCLPSVVFWQTITHPSPRNTFCLPRDQVALIPSPEGSTWQQLVDLLKTFLSPFQDRDRSAFVPNSILGNEFLVPVIERISVTDIQTSSIHTQLFMQAKKKITLPIFFENSEMWSALKRHLNFVNVYFLDY